MPPQLLLSRATFGVTPELVVLSAGRSVRQWLQEQLTPERLPDPVVEALLPQFPALALSTAQFVAQSIAANRGGNWDQMTALNELAVARAVWSQRQLLERMVDFWSNHFNVTSPSDGVWATRADYDAGVIRACALGTFRDLLRGVIHHPAMLIYLNNDVSSKDAPNENLGRELLELHTVGVGAGYTEAEVVSSARILTGLSRDWTSQAYVYRPDWHWTGAVRVLGFSHANPSADGRAVVVAYLDYLARHPATATRIATLLCQYFVSDSPPSALVRRMAAVYTGNDTAIAPVLQEMFTSGEFAASAGGKARRPAEQLFAAARILGIGAGTGVAGIQQLYWTAQGMANEPNAWLTPDGYPTSAQEWRSSGAMVTRVNAVMALAQGWWKTLHRPAVTGLLPHPLPADHAGLVSALHDRLHYRAMAAADVAAVCSFLEVKPTAALTATSPVLEPTWALPQLVGLILNAPALATT